MLGSDNNQASPRHPPNWPGFVRMKEQPEAVGPSEERAIQGVAKKTLEGKQQTEGLTNKQMKESNKQHSKV